MPVTVKFTDTTHCDQQSQIINDATRFNDGVMTKAQVALLEAAVVRESVGDILVFRPGAIPPLASNVFNDWATLMAAADIIEGLKFIEFDDSIISPCVIPPGTWDMSGVIWSSNLNSIIPMVMVQVDEGAIFRKLRAIQNAVAVTFTGSTPPISDFTVGRADGLGLSNGSRLTCVGTGPFVRNSIPGSLAIMSLSQGATLLTGATPVFDVAAGQGIVVAFAAGVAQANTMSSAPGTIIDTSILASAGFIDQNQPAILGTFNNNNQTIQRLNPTQVITSGMGTYNAQRNDLVRCDLSTGNISVMLPPAFNAKGMWVVVKNLDLNPEANNIAVTASLGDTVDGGVAFLFNTPRQSVTYVSDGISDWLAI